MDTNQKQLEDVVRGVFSGQAYRDACSRTGIDTCFACGQPLASAELAASWMSAAAKVWWATFPDRTLGAPAAESSKMNEEQLEKVVRGVFSGQSYRDACALAGIEDCFACGQPLASAELAERWLSACREIWLALFPDQRFITPKLPSDRPPAVGQ